MLKKIAALGLAIFGLSLKSCIPDGLKSGYQIEDNQVVFYHGFPASRQVIGQADPKSFKSIKDEYGKDKNHVFYYGKIIPQADPASFKHLAGAYSKDKNYGFTRDEIISHDGAHFEIVPNPNEKPGNVTAEGIVYARDREKVFRDNVPVAGADPATFEFVPMFNGNYLARDRYHVFWHDQPLEGADGETFKAVSEFHFKDKNKAWCLSLGRETAWVPMTGVDVPTFVGLKRLYAKDKNQVYYEDRVVEGADLATFEETENHQAKDKNGTYQSGKKQ
ncbi:DKNYY domain-containing protein [Haliscomenobacter sp.]|uniref:DKNYY domain-containing protein n=1 Tax=Haliscomenobacter sp. TaxID=2717303 RepID=UPI003BA941BC